MSETRTNIDWSRHIVETQINDLVRIDCIRLPNSRTNLVKFINCGGVMSVTGDFGNWIFCREFHPSKDGLVSNGYWDEKLRIGSVQKSHKWSSEETLKEIYRYKEDYVDENTDQEELDWLEDLENCVDDKYEYIYSAYRNNPSGVDAEYVPYGEKRHIWLDAVYDAFDEICKRMGDIKS